MEESNIYSFTLVTPNDIEEMFHQAATEEIDLDQLIETVTLAIRAAQALNDEGVASCGLLNDGYKRLEIHVPLGSYLLN